MVDLRAYWLADAAEDELTFNLALFYHVLVGACHRVNLFRDIGVRSLHKVYMIKDH